MRTILFAFLCLSFASLPARAACVAPDGDAGTQMYNSTHNVMQYCNGDDWIAMGVASAAVQEDDPTIGTMMAEGWCKSDGTSINCDQIEPASGPPTPAISESTSVNCTATLIPLSLTCTATCPAGFYRSGCFATLGTALPVANEGCFCATPDLQCTAFCVR